MIIHQVFTKKQTMVLLTITKLIKHIKEDKIKLREVSQPHVRAIKRYFLENVVEEQIYFPPIVAHLEEGSLENGLNGVLTIIDGSHRLRAFLQLEENLLKLINSEKDDDMKRGYKLLNFFENTSLPIQIFEGFTLEEKDQLYIDLNTKGKKVSLSKRIAYDSRNQINQITNHVLQLNDNLKVAGVEMEKTAIIRPSNKKLLSLTQLRQIVGIFLTEKIMHSTAEVTLNLPLKSNEYMELINIWLDELFMICPAVNIGNYHESMLASYPLLVSLALYVNNGMQNADYEKRGKELRERMEKLKEIDFSRENEIWNQFSGSIKGKEKYFYLSNNKRTIGQLVNWLQNLRR